MYNYNFCVVSVFRGELIFSVTITILFFREVSACLLSALEFDYICVHSHQIVHALAHPRIVASFCALHT